MPYEFEFRGTERPTKNDMKINTLYLYSDQYEECYYFAFINQEKFVQRMPLILSEDRVAREDSEKIRRGEISAEKANHYAKKLLEPKNITDLYAQHLLLIKEFQIELNLRNKYNRKSKPPGVDKEKWQANCDKFYEEAEKLLKSIDVALPIGFDKPTAGQQFLGKKSPAEQLHLMNQVLERALRVFVVPQASEKQAYVKNLEQMQLLSQELLGRFDKKIQRIGISMKQFIGISLIIVSALLLAFPPTIPLGVVGIVGITASLLPILQPSLMGLIGVFCLVNGREKGVTKALINLKDTATTMNEAIISIDETTQPRSPK